jgi:DNA-binding MarR family transcriptional regulator
VSGKPVPPRGAETALADEVWRAMASLVIDNHDSWKRAVVERTGLPFSRVRILSRLAKKPMSVKQIAQSATVDAPAATVAVNDLERRGLVVRETDPANRRCKVVSLTDAGRDMVQTISSTDDPAPEVLTGLDGSDLEALRAILAKLSGA